MDFVKIAKSLREREQKIIEQAHKRIPAEFHDFLILLEQQQCLSRFTPKQPISEEAQKLGVWMSDKREGVYMPIKTPYMAVDGRVAMMVARQNGQPYSLIVEPEQINDEWFMRATFEGLAANGTPCKTVGRAKIGFGGKSVDSTNPVENAETSAIGRALAFAGYGLIGTGIASAEEVSTAIAEATQMEQAKQPVRKNSEKTEEIATEAQRRKIWAQMKELGWAPEDIKKLCQEQYGKPDTKVLTRSEASEFIEHLQTIIDIRNADLDVENVEEAGAEAP